MTSGQADPSSFLHHFLRQSKESSDEPRIAEDEPLEIDHHFRCFSEEGGHPFEDMLRIRRISLSRDLADEYSILLIGRNLQPRFFHTSVIQMYMA